MKINSILNNQEEKIFCIGLSRTGTTSLCHAFRSIGWSANHFPRGIKAINECKVSTDIPVIWFWQKGILEDLWPNAKYILTYRDPESWLNGAERFWGLWPAERYVKPAQVRMIRKAHNICYGAVKFDKQVYKKAYHQHNLYVRDYFKGASKEKFLELNICAGEGWEKLAPWLGIDVPENKEFPHLNSVQQRIEEGKGNVTA